MSSALGEWFHAWSLATNARFGCTRHKQTKTVKTGRTNDEAIWIKAIVVLGTVANRIEAATHDFGALLRVER
jgi:hypothetical protein